MLDFKLKIKILLNYRLLNDERLSWHLIYQNWYRRVQFCFRFKERKVVKNFLEKYGIEQERPKVISYGKLNPAKLGHNKEAKVIIK